jgi:hypothetical protein
MSNGEDGGGGDGSGKDGHDKDGHDKDGHDKDGHSLAPEGHAQFTTDEQQRIRDAWRTDGQTRCPRCDVVMHRRAIGGGSFGLGYARRRFWLLCPRCRRSAIFDAARGTRN